MGKGFWNKWGEMVLSDQTRSWATVTDVFLVRKKRKRKFHSRVLDAINVMQEF